MLFDYLKRGVAAGTVAGIVYGLYLFTVVNPLTEYIHDAGHEQGADHGHGGDHGTGGDHSLTYEHAHEHGHEHAVSELTTAIVSAGSGLLWAMLLGGMFAVALYLLEPALPGSDGVKSYVLAGCGFLTVSLTPWLVLPPAAPGAEQLYSVDARLGIYAGLVVLGVLLAGAALLISSWLDARSTPVRIAGSLIPVGAFLGLLAVLTPTVVTHTGVPGELVTAYQALAVLSQVGIWVLIAATHNWLRGRGTSSTKTEPRDELTVTPAQ